MPNAVQDFLASATQKAADDLIATLETIPPDKRTWKPAEGARSAMDQFAECAILNGSTAETILNRTGPSAEFMGEYATIKDGLVQDEAAARVLLEKNTAQVIAAIRTVPTEDLDATVVMPWGPMALHSLCAYPFWNMTYHQGQIVYIASLLGD
ncbi:MAG: DinB family protein [Armatimonadota bacterium]